MGGVNIFYCFIYVDSCVIVGNLMDVIMEVVEYKWNIMIFLDIMLDYIVNN